MSKDSASSSVRTEQRECAYRTGAAAAIQTTDGTWEAQWEEWNGREEARLKKKAGFSSEAEAFAFAKKLELVARLNRC